MTEATTLAPLPRVRWGVWVVEGDRLRKPGLVAPSDELVLLVGVTHAAGRLAIELYRGDVLRDRQEWLPVPGDGEAVLAMRLGHSPSPSASSRLRCCLLLDGRAIGQRTVLLGAPRIDAQGRLADRVASVPSTATQLAYVRLLEEEWQPGERGP